MLDSDNPRIALVTGTNRGIGRYLAKRLLTIGFNVVGCARSPSSWEADGYSFFQCDVGDETMVVDMFRQIRRLHNHLDVIINNAGQASMNHALLTPYAVMDNMFRVNAISAFLVSREAAKMMRAKGGRIVNFTTVAVPLSLEGEAAYVAAKSAVEGLTRTLAREFAEFGVTVNAVGPSPVKTHLTLSVPAQSIQRLLARLPIGQWAEPEDVWNVVEFFLRPESHMITGQIVYLGGV